MWPYVNGKALFNGIDLKNMGAEDMVDVLHFIFEEDNHYVSEESAKSRSAVRVSIFQELYGTTYKYAHKASKNEPSARGSNGYVEDYSDLAYMSDAESQKSFGPQELSEPMKPPAQRPTEFNPYNDNPFAGILDAPMN